MVNRLPITAAGHAALEDELKHRIRVERPRLVQRIQQAIADDADLAENSEYHAASTDQEVNEVRIAELEDKLARAEVIDPSKLSGDTIRFGAVVTLIEEDSREKKSQSESWCFGLCWSRASLRSIRHNTTCAGVTGRPSVIDQRAATVAIDVAASP